MHAAALFLALTFSPADAPAPPGADAEAVEVHDLATLTPAEAVRLQGGRALYRVVVVQHYPCGLCEAKAPGGGEAALTLPGPRVCAPGEAVVVEAELQLDYYPPGLDKDGTLYPEAWDYRLEKAAAVGK
jgi:hypothetical protein